MRIAMDRRATDRIEAADELPRAREKRALMLVTLSLFSAIGFASIALAVLSDMRESSWQRARAEAINVVSIMTAEISRTIRGYDHALHHIARTLEGESFGNLQEDIQRKLLFSGIDSADDVAAIHVIDTTGRVLFRSDWGGVTGVGDQLAILHHLNASGDRMHIGGPLPDPKGTHAVTLSRAFHFKNGSVAGVVTVTLPVQYFRDLFASVRLSPEADLGITYRDERIVFRTIDYGHSAGEDLRGSELSRQIVLSNGSVFEKASGIDGVHRVWVHDVVDDTPFRVVLGNPTAAIAQAFWSGARWLIVVVVMFALLLGGLTFGLVREFRSRHAAERALEQLANHDALTGLANRRKFDEVADDEWRRAARQGQPVALLMVDADRFKSYNDRYGHPTGDRLLRLLAAEVRAAARRPGDLAARLGGEEFAILLPGASGADARAVAERLRASIAALAIPHAGSALGHVTVSVGVASRVPGRDGTSIADLVREADVALYAAKAAGRDRVALAEALEPPIPQAA